MNTRVRVTEAHGQVSICGPSSKR